MSYTKVDYGNVKDFFIEKKGKYKFNENIDKWRIYENINKWRIYNFGNGAVVARYDGGKFFYFTDSTGGASIPREEFKTQLKIRKTKVWRAMYG